MSRSLILFAVLFIILTVTIAQAEKSHPRFMRGNEQILYGGMIETQKSVTDTLLLMGPWGSGAAYNGQFKTPGGEADWNDWTHEDPTASLETAWHVDTYNAAYLNGHPAGNLAAHCGDPTLPACSAIDTVGGYSDNYYQIIDWIGIVADPAQGCRLEFDAWLNYDLEVAYDYLHVQILAPEGGVVNLTSLDGFGANVNLQVGFDLQPYMYHGAGQNEVHLRLLVESDGAYSDFDCLAPSKGACQIDDITVTLDNGGTVSFTDFEDASLGDWTPQTFPGVGDFTQLRNNLEDVDPCQTNYSWQVCFIDDGIVVPGTGGTPCLTWCYGPSGYILNNTGGLAGDGFYLENYAISPPMAWPAGGYNGGELSLDAYLHMTLDSGDPGIFAVYDIRSINTGNPDDLELAPWKGFSFFYYGEGYERLGGHIGHMLATDATHIQVRVGAYEIGYVWGWESDDGTPAPYFDNVRLTAYRYNGPYMYSHPAYLAQDAFPAGGVLNLESLGENSVPFDMAANTWTGDLPGIDPGDSLVCSVSPMGSDTYLTTMPRLYYKLLPNPLFDPYRSAGLPNAGFVAGDSVRVNGVPLGDRFAFSLPDVGFLFPGDQLHYYLVATQWDPSLGLTTSLLPADTTGFSNFESIASYDPVFSFRALPSLVADSGTGAEHEVKMLVWDDSGRQAQIPLWQEALAYCNETQVAEFDYFYSNTYGADEVGLGQAASVAQLAGYDYILYTSGDDDSLAPLGSGEEYHGLSPDIPLLDAWLQLGDKGLLLSGDDLLYGLNASDAGLAFLNKWVGVSVVSWNIEPLIGGQVTPGVAGTDLLMPGLNWIANGGCPYIRTFDAVTTQVGAERLAEFLSPTGVSGLYPYSAATGNPDAATGSRVVSLPYAMERIEESVVTGLPGTSPSAQAEVLNQLLTYLNVPVKWWGNVPEAGVLTATHYPNPFNPQVRIDFSLPKQGPVQLKVYDLKGGLVRTLLDEQHEAGPHHVIWDGTDDGGRASASGVYFYEVTAGMETVLGKVTMLK